MLEHFQEECQSIALWPIVPVPCLAPKNTTTTLSGGRANFILHHYQTRQASQPADQKNFLSTTHRHEVPSTPSSSIHTAPTASDTHSTVQLAQAQLKGPRPQLAARVRSSFRATATPGHCDREAAHSPVPQSAHAPATAAAASEPSLCSWSCDTSQQKWSATQPKPRGLKMTNGAQQPVGRSYLSLLYDNSDPRLP